MRFRAAQPVRSAKSKVFDYLSQPIVLEDEDGGTTTSRRVDHALKSLVKSVGPLWSKGLMELAESGWAFEAWWEDGPGRRGYFIQLLPEPPTRDCSPNKRSVRFAELLKVMRDTKLSEDLRQQAVDQLAEMAAEFEEDCEDEGEDGVEDDAGIGGGIDQERGSGETGDSDDSDDSGETQSTAKTDRRFEVEDSDDGGDGDDGDDDDDDDDEDDDGDGDGDGGVEKSKSKSRPPEPVPELTPDFITGTHAILAKKGSGKSYTSMYYAEKFCEKDYPFVVLDPTGAWWGLRSNTNGEPRGGHRVLILGGRYGDLPLDPSWGGVVARYVIEHYPRQVLVDFTSMTTDEMHTFAHKFFVRLFAICDKAIHLFIDEADEFAPQQPEGGAHSKCLKALDRVVRRGRIKGIGTTLITQRSAVLHKNVLSQVSAVFALLNKSPHDLKQIEDWAKANLDNRKQVKRVMALLPRMNTGEGLWLDSNFKKPVRKKADKRTTFDSSKTPKHGDPSLSATKVKVDDLKGEFEDFMRVWAPQEFPPEQEAADV